MVMVPDDLAGENYLTTRRDNMKTEQYLGIIQEIIKRMAMNSLAMRVLAFLAVLLAPLLCPAQLDAYAGGYPARLGV